MNVVPGDAPEHFIRAGIPSADLALQRPQEIEYAKTPIGFYDPVNRVLEIPLPPWPQVKSGDQSVSQVSDADRAANPSSRLPEGVAREYNGAGLPKRRKDDVFDVNRKEAAGFVQASEVLENPKKEKKVIAIGIATVPTKVNPPAGFVSYPVGKAMQTEFQSKSAGRHREGVAPGTAAQQKRFLDQFGL